MQRNVKIFTGGCPLCKEAIQKINRMSCPYCNIEILDINEEKNFVESKKYGITAVPSIVVNNELADCCKNGRIDENILRKAGIGKIIK